MNSAWSSKCDNPTCTGHLGKFSSCLDEAVWQGTLDSGSETTGSTEYEGHLCFEHYPTDETVTLNSSDILVTVPAGWYLVESTDQGFVYVTHYASESEAREIFKGADERYGAWLDTDESEI